MKENSQNAYHSNIQRRLRRTTWNSGCSSWYLTEDGYNGTMYPGFATQFIRELSRLDMRDYEITRRDDAGLKLTQTR